MIIFSTQTPNPFCVDGTAFLTLLKLDVSPVLPPSILDQWQEFLTTYTHFRKPPDRNYNHQHIIIINLYYKTTD
jgi:hypothetical protein